MKHALPLLILCLAASRAVFAPVAALGSGERINHEGRILGPVPVVTSPVLFNTAQADGIVAAMQIMPVDSPWNEDVSRHPLLANSNAMIAQIMADLASSRQTLRPFYEMNYVLVPDSQPTVAVSFFNYPDESDPSPYPIPSNLPVEGWPRDTGGLTLLQWQQDVNNTGGDRHAIMVEPGAGSIWETWLTRLTATGWQASNGARFDLKTNALRPAGWTSGDAAGLPMFPAVVRYDECERGMVEHALRLVVKRTRVGPIYPATHQASVGSTTDPKIPAMGQRLRLKAGFAIPETWTTEEKAVLLALKKYGAIVADNGGFFSVSVCPDDRFAATAFDHLSTVNINNFEVVQSTGLTEGPRSAGAPSVDAAADVATATTNVPVTLGGTAVSPTGAALTVAWKLYAGPGNVAFADPTQAGTTATFSAPGVYTLMLSAADGIHAGAYDALVVTVNDPDGGSPSPGQPPAITSAGEVNATVGRLFAYQITATNTPTGFGATGLPADLRIDPSTGLISGTPTGAAGTYPVTLTATNASGTSTAALALTVTVDTPTVAVTVAGDGMAIEGSQNGKVSVRRTGDTNAALTVRYKVKGAARRGVDYQPTSGILTIPVGAVQAKVKIKPIDNHVADGVRIAKVKLAPSTDGSYRLGEPAAAKIKIVDGD